MHAKLFMVGPSGQGENHFFPVIWTHILACEDMVGGSRLSGVGIIFILRVIRRHFLRFEDVAGGSSCQPHSLKSTFDDCHSLTSLTTRHREHQGGGRWRGLGREQRGAREDKRVDAHAEGSTRVHWFGCGVRLPSPEKNRRCW